MRLLDNILALLSCGKPQATFMAHLLALLQWQPGRVLTGLKTYGGRRPVPMRAGLGVPSPSRAWP